MESAKLLLAAGVDINLRSQPEVSNSRALSATGSDGATPLLVATMRGQVRLALFLLEQGADPNAVDKDAAMGPLYAAADMHRLAVGHGRPNPKPSGSLDAVDITRKLLEKKADPNATLKAAIMQRQHTIGDSTLAAGATPLMRAAKSGETAIVALLLDAGADPKATLANGNNALMFAAGLGWRDGSPAAPSYDQGSPEDAVATIELLLTKGLDINGTNTNGDTPLHAAVSGRASPEIVRVLIQHGARIDVPNKRGQTPLALASSARGTKDLSAIAEILKTAGARPTP